MSDAPLLAILSLAALARRQIRSAVKDRQSPRRSLSAILADMLPIESLLAYTFRDAQLLAWSDAGAELAKIVPQAKHESPPASPTGFEPRQLPLPENGTLGGDRPPLPPEPAFPRRPGDPQPVVRFPAIEKAARHLQTRLAFTPEEFRQVDDATREVGFTVAKAMSLDAVEKVRDALSADVAEGGTLKAFRRRIADVIDESALSPAKVETIYRTHTARAYAAGQQQVLDHPLIADEFPYVLRAATHDARVRPEHLALEHLGMFLKDGSRGAIYRADDPVIRKYWSPWSWACRCMDIPMSREDAARRGVKEAIEWVRTGIPPVNPEYVPDPGFPLPNGWVPVNRGLRAVL